MMPYGYILIGTLLIVINILYFKDYRWQKKNWNNGTCEYCNNQWEHCDTYNKSDIYACACSFMHITFKRIVK